MKRAWRAMVCRRQSKRPVRIEQVLARLLVVVILALPELGWTAGQSGPVADEAGPQSAGTMPTAGTRPPVAEVTFASPSRFAIITELASRRQRLHKAGDVILEPNGAEWKILEIEQGRLRISNPRTRKASWVAEGSLLPGMVKRLVTGTPALSSVEYRYVPTEGPLDAEPRVVELRENRVALEVDVPPIVSVSPLNKPDGGGTAPPLGRSSEASRKPEKTLLGRVRVKATAKDAYEINAADLRAALDQGGKVLAEMWPKASPNVSFRQGVSLDLQSPVADGTLGPRGFRVTSPNLAERGGIEVGDVILAVNGQPINNLVDLYRLYGQFQKDASLTLIHLDLERQGRPITKTYRIR